ncbi:MAG: flagellar biosynthetic protein FliO, partial [Armatimonadota bacterium]
VVIILVWAGGRALRLYVNRRQATSESAATGDLKVGERACLGPDRSLYIVEAAGQRLLISVDATATTLLAHLNPAGVSQDDDGRDHQPCAEAVCERRDAVAPDDVRARAVKRRLVAEALVRRSREAQENGDGP